MLRLIVSLVFCFSMIASSHAHAAMRASQQMQSVLTEQSDTHMKCWKKAAFAISADKTRCIHMANTKPGGQRCQVDIAPLVSALEIAAPAITRDNLMMNCHAILSIERGPPLDPPRILQVS